MELFEIQMPWNMELVTSISIREQFKYLALMCHFSTLDLNDIEVISNTINHLSEMDSLSLDREHHIKDQYITICSVSESLCDKLPTEKEIIHPYPSLQFMSNAREISEELYNDFHNGEGELDCLFDRYNLFYILFYHLFYFDPTREKDGMLLPYCFFFWGAFWCGTVIVLF